MLDLKQGDAVIVPDGRIGMISSFIYTIEPTYDEEYPGPYRKTGIAWVRVQFGAAGPFSRYRPASLRWATLQEVKDAGKYGTGFNIRIPHETPSAEKRGLKL